MKYKRCGIKEYVNITYSDTSQTNTTSERVPEYIKIDHDYYKTVKAYRRIVGYVKYLTKP